MASASQPNRVLAKSGPQTYKAKASRSGVPDATSAVPAIAAQTRSSPPFQLPTPSFSVSWAERENRPPERVIARLTSSDHLPDNRHGPQAEKTNSARPRRIPKGAPRLRCTTPSRKSTKDRQDRFAFRSGRPADSPLCVGRIFGALLPPLLHSRPNPAFSPHPSSRRWRPAGFTQSAPARARSAA